jgi:hypothetical protein
LHTSHHGKDFWIASSDREQQALESIARVRSSAVVRADAPRGLAHTQNELTPPGSDTPLLLARHSEVLIRQTSAVTNAPPKKRKAHEISEDTH